MKKLLLSNNAFPLEEHITWKTKHIREEIPKQTKSSSQPPRFNSGGLLTCHGSQISPQLAFRWFQNPRWLSSSVMGFPECRGCWRSARCCSCYCSSENLNQRHQSRWRGFWMSGSRPRAGRSLPDSQAASVARNSTLGWTGLECHHPDWAPVQSIITHLERIFWWYTPFPRWTHFIHGVQAPVAQSPILLNGSQGFSLLRAQWLSVNVRLRVGPVRGTIRRCTNWTGIATGNDSTYLVTISSTLPSPCLRWHSRILSISFFPLRRPNVLKPASSVGVREYW